MIGIPRGIMNFADDTLPSMDITEFTESYSESQKTIVMCIDALFMQTPGVHLKSRYKLPFYYRHSWVAYINPLTKGGVELCFTKGYLLSNANRLLESRGRSMISGVVYKSVDQIDLIKLNETFHEALIIDEETRPMNKRPKN